VKSGAGTEGRQEGHEFLEVQSVQHPQQTLQCYQCQDLNWIEWKLNREKERDLRERINGEFGNGEEFIGRDETAVVAIELTETLVQRNNLLLRNYTRTRENQRHVNEIKKLKDLEVVSYKRVGSVAEPLRCRIGWAWKMCCPWLLAKKRVSVRERKREEMSTASSFPNCSQLLSSATHQWIWKGLFSPCGSLTPPHSTFSPFFSTVSNSTFIHLNLTRSFLRSILIRFFRIKFFIFYIWFYFWKF